MNRLWKEWERIRSSSLARNAGWVLAGQGLSIIFQSVYFILLARLLGSTQYGIYAGVFAMVYVLAVYSSMGSPFVLLRCVSADRSKFALYWGNVLATIFFLGSLFIGVLVFAVPHLARSYSWILVLCAALADCFCNQLIDAASRVFQAFENMRIMAILSLLVNFLRLLLAGFLLWRMSHATAQQWVAASLVVSVVAACAALALVTYYYGKPAFSQRLLRQSVGEGVVFAMSSSTMAIYNNIDRALLGHYGMNAANGIYSMAYRVIDMATIPIASVHAAAFPRFFRKGIEGIQSTTAYAFQILKRTSPMALLFTLAMAATAPLIPHLVGKSFNDSVSALRWLCLLPVFRSFQLSAGDALTGSGHLKLRLSIQATAAAFNFGVNLYLIPHFGWLGAAWSSLATDGLLGAFNWAFLLAIRMNLGNLKVQPSFPAN
jgi:O-antigen/teichoic acid export membrane protein